MTFEAIEQINIPVRYTDLDDGESKFKIEKWPILYPHMVMHFLFQKSGLKISTDAISKYWRHHHEFGAEWAQDPRTHAMVPLGIFGDGARVNLQFGGSTNVVGIFMNLVLFRPKSVRMSRFLLFTIGEEQLWGYSTINAVLRRLVWSFNQLFTGHHPTTDWVGKELPPHLAKLSGTPITSDGLKFCVTEVRGEWSWHKKIWRWPRVSWKAISMCHWCRAVSKGEWTDLYWNFTPQSQWHDNEFTLDEFMEERLPEQGICFLKFT